MGPNSTWSASRCATPTTVPLPAGTPFSTRLPVCDLLRESIDRIAVELHLLSLTASLPSPAPVLLAHPILKELSPREQEVLMHLVAGERVPAIARQLHISPHTVRNHLKSMYRKLGVSAQSELIQKVRKICSPDASSSTPSGERRIPDTAQPHARAPRSTNRGQDHPSS